MHFMGANVLEPSQVPRWSTFHGSIHVYPMFLTLPHHPFRYKVKMGSSIIIVKTGACQAGPVSGKHEKSVRYAG